MGVGGSCKAEEDVESILNETYDQKCVRVTF